MHLALVLIQINLSVKSFLANLTMKAFLLMCAPHVTSQVALSREGFCANFAFESRTWKSSKFSLVNGFEMNMKIFPLAEEFVAELTFKGFLLVSGPHVHGERILASKDFMAKSAIEFGLGGSIRTIFHFLHVGRFSLVDRVRGLVLGVSNFSIGFLLWVILW